MKITRKLIGYLNRVFDKQPDPVFALQLRYDSGGSMQWQVADNVLTTTVTGGPGVSMQINLGAFTISSLASYLAAQPGYSVPFVSPDLGSLSARVLLDASGDPSQSNGDHLYAYTSLLWAWLEPIASELQLAADQIDQAVLQMVPQTASGEWLDELGTYYAVTRAAGEPDGLYAPRIVAEVLQPRGNNIAIANAVDTVAGGGSSRVNDAPLDVTSNSYGLFDLDVSFDLDRLAAYGMEPVLTSALSIVARFRDAGTQLRKLRAIVTFNSPLYWAAATLSGDTTSVLPYAITDITSSGPIYFSAATIVYDEVTLLPLTVFMDGSHVMNGTFSMG